MIWQDICQHDGRLHWQIMANNAADVQPGAEVLEERRSAIVRRQQPAGEDGVVRIPHVVGGLTVKQVTGSLQHPPKIEQT